jgi:hypothetical protein
VWPAVIAFVICLGAQHAFNLVDAGLAQWVPLGVLILPWAIGYAWTSVSWEALVWWDVAALLLLAFLLAGNGWLDKATPKRVQATVVYRHSSEGRRVSYQLTVVPSWRPGRRTETLNVGRTVYNRTHDLETISLDLHPGYFHLPWYDHVAPAASDSH